MFSQVRQASGLMLTAGVAAAAALATISPATAQTVPPVATAPGWPQLQGNAAHTGYEALEKSVTRQNVGQLGVAWTAALDGPSTASEPAVAGGLVYVNAGGTLTAYNASSGTQAWQASLGGAAAHGTPAVQNGLVLVSSENVVNKEYEEWVRAFSSSSGAPVWTKLVFERRAVNVTGEASGTVTTTAARAYVTLLSGRVLALGLAHGHVLWRSAALAGCAFSAPSVSGGLAVVSGAGVTALDASTGQVAWTADPGGTSCTTGQEIYLPAISGGTVYAGTDNGVAALSLTSGNLLWQDTALVNDLGPFSVTGSTLLLTTPAGGGKDDLVALSRSTGSVLWQRDLNAGAGPVATFGGLTWDMQVPGQAADYQAVAFNAGTGARLFATGLYGDESQVLPPVVSAGHLYVNTGGQLVCLALPGAG